VFSRPPTPFYLLPVLLPFPQFFPLYRPFLLQTETPTPTLTYLLWLTAHFSPHVIFPFFLPSAPGAQPVHHPSSPDSSDFSVLCKVGITHNRVFVASVFLKKDSSFFSPPLGPHFFHPLFPQCCSRVFFLSDTNGSITWSLVGLTTL